jgi:predicted RNA methylase
VLDQGATSTADTTRLPGPARTRSGYVRTPDDIADLLCAPPHHDLQWLPAGAHVLEPSAGDGSLVAAILRANPAVAVTAVEPDPVRAAVCATAGDAVQVTVSTFERYATCAIRDGVQFDAIVMNPPFALAGQADVWFEHLRVAWQLLRPSARLVAVVPANFTFRSSQTHRDARTFIEHHGTHEPLPADAFTPSGTTVATRIARLTKPLTATRTEHLLHADTSSAPVRVAAPQLTAAAAATMPVQVWYSAWTGEDRVLRYHGRCWLFSGAPEGPMDRISAYSHVSGVRLNSTHCNDCGARVVTALASGLVSAYGLQCPRTPRSTRQPRG